MTGERLWLILVILFWTVAVGVCFWTLFTACTGWDTP